MKKLHLILSFVFLFVFLNCNGSEEPEGKKPNDKQTWANAQEINKRLGRGINIGNTFEAEQSWQSPFDPADLKRIADLGFSHVRLPIRWERDDRSAANSPYTINSEFLKTVKAIVDEALRNKLHIIINMHHHDALIADPAGQKNRFLSQWEQISNYFSDYPDSLLFEILNEPNGPFTAEIWNEYSKDALQVIRRENPKRCVLLGVAEWGGVDGLRKLDVPDDENLILSIHYYLPFNFTHQGANWVDGSQAWLGTQWQDTEFERQAIAEDFKYAINLSNEKNIPIHIGEFGAFSRADMESRVKWTRFLSRWFEQQNFSWAYWEWNAGFGIYNPQNKSYNQPLVDALVKDNLPEAHIPNYTLVYKSNFSNGQNDGWFLTNNDASAQSAMNIAANKVTFSIAQPGTEGWHIQFIKPNINIQQGKTYRLRFNAYSPENENRSISANISKGAEPWTSYGGRSFSIDKTESEYNLVFKSVYSDNEARIVFSMGNAGNSSVVLSDIQLMEVEF